MLIYNKEGKLVACTSDDALQCLGFESVREFFNLYDDISQVFVQKRGYIASYENLSWINFIFNDILPQRKVLVSVDNEEKEFEVVYEDIFSNDMKTVSIGFKACDTNTQEQQKPVTDAQSQTQEPEKPEKDQENDDELLELLNAYDDTPAKEEQEKDSVVEETAPEKSSDDVEPFELSFMDEEPKQEVEKKEEKPQQNQVKENDVLEELYDFETSDETEEKEDELENFTLDFEEETKDEPVEEEKKETDDDFTLEFKDEEDEKKDEFTQYIDSDEHASSKEVDLQNLSNELGLEEQECANFIFDFTNMVKAKESLLNGENASIEAASLKNIAENFRLKNIVKTLETIENGEQNASLLFSQINKLQKELSPHTNEEQNQASANGSVTWADAQKTAVEFDPNIAAESLGLPTELISEFVVDFIEQAQESKDIFDEAYDKGDLKTIQENAHKLKGAAANLRIEPIASKLEELQHNEDIEAVPQMLQDFWGMYLGLKEVV